MQSRWQCFKNLERQCGLQARCQLTIYSLPPFYALPPSNALPSSNSLPSVHCHLLTAIHSLPAPSRVARLTASSPSSLRLAARKSLLKIHGFRSCYELCIRAASTNVCSAICFPPPLLFYCYCCCHCCCCMGPESTKGGRTERAGMLAALSFSALCLAALSRPCESGRGNASCHLQLLATPR